MEETKYNALSSPEKLRYKCNQRISENSSHIKDRWVIYLNKQILKKSISVIECGEEGNRILEILALEPIDGLDMPYFGIVYSLNHAQSSLKTFCMLQRRLGGVELDSFISSRQSKQNL